MNLLADKHLDSDVSKEIAQTLGQFAQDEATIRLFATIMLKSNIADSIHRALWAASRRARVSINVVDEPTGKRVELVKW